MVFQGPVATIRWVGNEDGMAGYPCWATVPHLDAAGNGDPDGPIWQPGECDVPVRNHDWFWHPNREHTLYPVDQLVQMYYHSVGRNCNLLLNANINRDGLVPEADMQRYREFGAEIRRRFGRAVAAVEGRGETVELRLGKERPVDHVVAMERIQAGERVREYVVEGQTAGGWRELCRGQSIGHKRIESFPEVAVTALRLRVTRSVAEPLIRRFAAYHAG
jgi:alpha-L-fucosidase